MKKRKRWERKTSIKKRLRSPAIKSTTKVCPSYILLFFSFLFVVSEEDILNEMLDKDAEVHEITAELNRLQLARGFDDRHRITVVLSTCCDTMVYPHSYYFFIFFMPLETLDYCRFPEEKLETSR